jgi:hypothetical protein
MKKTDLLIGVLIALAATALGSFIFIELFTPYHFMDGVAMYKSHGVLGKIITLGAIMNVVIFFVLLKFNKDLMARGVILGTIILTILTLLI